MREGTIQFSWREPLSTHGFRSGVCLHGHTMHSQECLSFPATVSAQGTRHLAVCQLL